MLDKIISRPQESRSSVNNLVTAWALQKTGKLDEAKKLLNDWKKNGPDSGMATWAMDVYNGENITLPEVMNTNENTRVLQQVVILQ